MRGTSLVFLASNAFAMNPTPASTQFVTFSEPAMNFTFSYPDDFRPLPPQQPLLGECLTTPLRLAGKSDRPYERVLINEIDYDCLKRDTPQIGPLTRSTSNNLMNVYGHLEMGEPIDFVLDGHPAAFIKVTADVNGPLKGLEPGMKLYAAQTCVLLGHRVACWNVLSSDQTRLSILSAGKVSINGHPGQAWVPQR